MRWDRTGAAHQRGTAARWTAELEALAKAEAAGKEKLKQLHRENPAHRKRRQPESSFTPGTICKVRRNPSSDSRENSYLLQAYVTENGGRKMGDVFARNRRRNAELMRTRWAS